MKYFQLLKIKTQKIFMLRNYTHGVLLVKKKKKSQIGNITKIWKVKVQFHGDEGGKDVCVVCVPECVYVCVLV